MRRLLLSAAGLTGAVALLAGCGGGGGSSTTSATDWVNGYCSAATSWVTTLDQARAGVKAANPTATASDAAQQVTDETNTFIEVVKGLGEPDTPDGSTSAATAKSLTETLSGRIAHASAAIDTNNPDVTPAMQAKTVSEQVAASLSDVATTTGQLETNDAALGTAIKASADCAKLDKALAASG